MFVDDPLTHFLGVGVSLFVSFFLIGIINDYGTAVAFGFTVAGAIPLWDRTTLNVNDRVEGTLWLAGVVAMGVVVTVVVEYVFRRFIPPRTSPKESRPACRRWRMSYVLRGGRAASRQCVGEKTFALCQRSVPRGCEG